MRLIDNQVQLPVTMDTASVATAAAPRNTKMWRRRALTRLRLAAVSADTARTAASRAVDRAKFSVLWMGASRREVTNEGISSAAHTPANRMKRTISMVSLLRFAPERRPCDF